MTNRNSTKRALLSSVFAIVICAAMLIGTSFAWFTDTASTAVNKIVSGKLDVALEMKNNAGEWENAEGKVLRFKVNGRIPAEGTEILWEPGCTYELPELRVVNNGNLALKYKAAITGINGSAKLNEVIEWTVGETALGTEQHLLPRENRVFTVKGHMSETAGNEYQGLTIDGIAITVYATQDTVEYDSYGNLYDADAPAVLPEGVTADSFTDGNVLCVVGENGEKAYFGTLKDAMAATSASGSKVYAKPNSSVTANGTHFNVLGNLTIYGNGADFNGTDISVEQYAPLTADAEINIINTKNLYVWGTRSTDKTVTLNFENCLNDKVRLCYLNYGGTGLNFITVKNCIVSGIESTVYTSNAGSLTVEGCTFNNTDVAININTKQSGDMKTLIKNCVFNDCALQNGSWAAYNGVIRLVNTGNNTNKATVENCRFVYSVGNKAMQGDILLGDTRDFAKPCYPIELTVRNTNAVVQEFNGSLAARRTVEKNAVINHNGFKNGVKITPASTAVNYDSDKTYVLEPGDYGEFSAYLRSSENVTFIASKDARFKKVQIGYHAGQDGSLAAKTDSTLTVKGFNVSGDLYISAADQRVVAEGNTAGSITVKTHHIDNMDIRISDNVLTGGADAFKYGVYIVPNTTNYSLTVNGNSFSGIKSHAIGIQGSGDGSAVTAAKTITVKGNNFISYGLGSAAFKIWADQKLAPSSGTTANSAARELAEAVKANNSFSEGVKKDCILANFYDAKVAF